MRSTSIIVSLLALVISLSGCRANPETGRMQLRLLPADQVAQLGNEAKPDLIQQYGGEVPERELRDYIDEIGRRLTPHVAEEFADIEWDFVVLDSDVVNAFALPGGNVFISRGLLAHFNNEAQIAGVLGHEIGHVTGQHVDERLSNAVAAELGVAIVGGLTESQVAVAGARIFSTGYQLRFSRRDELEADSLGIQYMVDAGYDPQGMIQVLEILRDAAGGAAPPEILSTHPDPGRRIRDARQLIDEKYSRTIDSDDYELHEDRFRQRARPHVGTRRAAMPASGCWCTGCASLAAAR